ncbi:MAG: 4Fe-4S dicluster domain-containing protein [Desulfobacteraceae bacterium]|nr:4Fe-4S dicluster domain-containing protein [Desulfobacteraceae bacterium]
MAHHTIKSDYTPLVDRINRFPQGAPPSKRLDKILAMLFSKTEARLISQLPIKPVTAKAVAKIWNMSLPKARIILNKLASRAILVDIDQNGESQYVLPPPMAGFFEFSLMRTRDDIDQKVLSELFYQYLNLEEDFIKNLFTLGDTQLGRVFIHEPVLSNENAIHVLDYERASQVIKTASHMGISTCYCRHKMFHLDQACDSPMDICMTFNTSAASLIKHGHAKAVDITQGLDLLDQAHESNLVQFGENVRKGVNFICNCCGCCCEAMIAARRFAISNPIHTSNFIPVIRKDLCTGCGKCVTICPVEAMTLVSANDPRNKKTKKARLNEEICLGCGLCVRACREDSLALTPLEERVITPLNSTHKAVIMAIERGKLQHLIFDNRVLFSHRALAAVLGVILKLPPIKQILASQQVKSRYLEALISTMKVSDLI